MLPGRNVIMVGFVRWIEIEWWIESLFKINYLNLFRQIEIIN